MNVRSRKPVAGIARPTTSATETSSNAYIIAVSSRYGTTEVATSRTARRGSGAAYGANVSRQNNGSSRLAGARSSILASPLHACGLRHDRESGAAGASSVLECGAYAAYLYGS